jgi:nicotinamidase-related amidase
MRINKENTVAVVVDIQEKLLPHIENNDKITKNSLTLIKGLRVLGIPVIATQQYTKGLGNTIDSISEAVGNFSYIEKTSFSCYREPSFIKVLNRLGKRNVILLGVETHVCVMQTALDLHANNFNPVIITDATGSRKAEDKKVAIWRMRDEGCTMATTESILFELCLKAGTDEFKEISKLVK